MPQTKIRVFRNKDKTIPLFEWLDTLEEEEPEAFAMCLAAVLDLERKGSELRRPTADLLRDDIWELRTRVGKVRYRILYFFIGKDEAVLSHGFAKPGRKTPKVEIERAITRKGLVTQAPMTHLGTWSNIQ
jgi:phage-related protein